MKRQRMTKVLPVLGLVLGAVDPEGLAILLGTFIPVDLAVLMFPLLPSQTQKPFVRPLVGSD